MKRIIYFVNTVLLLMGCTDDFYSEGRIETMNVTEIDMQSAILNGKMQMVTKGKEADFYIQLGFVYGRSSNNLDRTVMDPVSKEGRFSCNISDLLPNTKYYVRALAIIGIVEEDRTITIMKRSHGNIIEFTTANNN